jgi:acyl-CoA synthetase (AMP-forming)/AMP-acid ligase II
VTSAPTLRPACHHDLLAALADPSRAGSPALTDGRRHLTYADLGRAVDERAAAFSRAGLAPRSVVLVSGGNSIDWIVSYLALLGERHVPILAADHLDRLEAVWSPSALVHADADGWRIDVRPGSHRPGLHDDLALLMSTSGSTGNPKLVRLSAENLVANATSIVEFQRLGADDVGITSLPLRYSFGLSILHSHLVAGASLVVTDTSVVDPCFRRLLVDRGVTNLAGVPHTYDMLNRVGPDHVRVPSLRLLAQAGGRMAPERVAEWAARAASWDAEWFAMYGQTEATARIAYVPPHDIANHVDAIGVAIPGGSLEIDPDAIDGADASTGEIVYRGPNVMLGYATVPADLASGRTVDELRTGDVGQLDPATGYLRVTGRLARRIKPFGLRIDLDDVERRLADRGHHVIVTGDDERVVAITEDGGDVRSAPGVARALAEVTGLPAARVSVLGGPVPRTGNGKIDYPAIMRAATPDPSSADRTAPGSGVETRDRSTALCAAYAAVLGRDRVDPTATFVSLGGDSLSYVECSIRLERLLGTLPTDWHLRPIDELATMSGRRRLARVDTTVVLRAIGILAVVSTHMRFRHVPGGAHLMLGVVGYNLARFMMPIDDTRERLRAGARTIGRVAIPTVLWTAAFMLVGQYTWTTLTLANNYIGPASHDANHWHFWFIEVFVHLVAITTLLYAIPSVRRADRRWPYAFPLALLGATLVLRMEWADMGDWYNLRFRTHAVAWFFVLGWLVQRSSTWQQRIVTTVLCLATAPGVFQNPRREYFIAVGLVLLVWVKEVPLPRPVVRPVATIAAASMWIFISHFMIWPILKSWFIIEVAYPLTVLVCLGVWWVATNGPRLLRERIAPAVRSRPFAARSGSAIPLA